MIRQRRRRNYIVTNWALMEANHPSINYKNPLNPPMKLCLTLQHQLAIAGGFLKSRPDIDSLGWKPFQYPPAPLLGAIHLAARLRCEAFRSYRRTQKHAFATTALIPLQPTQDSPSYAQLARPNPIDLANPQCPSAHGDCLQVVMLK